MRPITLFPKKRMEPLEGEGGDEGDNIRCWLTEVPDVILYHILTFAECPTNIAPVLSLTLSLVSKGVHQSIEWKREALWEIVLREYSTNTVSDPSCQKRKRHSAKDAATPNSPTSVTTASFDLRRQCKRSRRTTAKQDVMTTQRALLTRTDAVIIQVAEMALCRSEPLSLGRLHGLLRTKGPSLYINRRATFGTTLLIECCRARHVKEAVIRRCVRDLVENHGADPNVPAQEGDPDSLEGYSSYTPLLIASARAMPMVVQTLLDAGADPNIRGSSRFRLYKNPKITIKGDFLTPLEIATKMMISESKEGAVASELNGLRKVIAALQTFHQTSGVQKEYCDSTRQRGPPMQENEESRRRQQQLK
jgi:hypothetical protein